ncbi:hypothetical protein [Rhizobacter sp. SG703]|uniref:hypothetical protein n=1 Tax=Rhizobacter sp. SG703 TaxID=2587140 RepID=UPI001445C416|nr:hypothetical protein [Rhizobacter sp. SG703]NKI92366.1 hypothetical protein [Rhizobacter sp. SG703]
MRSLHLADLSHRSLPAARKLLPGVGVAVPVAVALAALAIGLPVTERADRNAFAADVLLMAAAVPAAAASAVPVIKREVSRVRESARGLGPSSLGSPSGR